MPGGSDFFTNKGYVLLALARQPDLRLREIAAKVGITERATQTIVNELVQDGYVERSRQGRRNSYRVHGEAALGHVLTKEHRVSDVVRAIGSSVPAAGSEGCDAVVLACGDYRYQDAVRELLSWEGLTDRAELLLYPGGGARLASAEGEPVLAELKTLADQRGAERVLLVAHQNCTAPGILAGGDPDPATPVRALIRLRRGAVTRVRDALGITPELWFIGDRWGKRVAVRTEPESWPGGPTGSQGRRGA